MMTNCTEMVTQTRMSWPTIFRRKYRHSCRKTLIMF